MPLPLYVWFGLFIFAQRLCKNSDRIINHQTNPRFHLYDSCFTEGWASEQNLCMLCGWAPDRSPPVQRFGALRRVWTLPSELKPSLVLHARVLSKKPSLHARGGKIREGGLEIKLKEPLQVWLLVAAEPAKRPGSRLSEEWPTLPSSLVEAVKLVKWSEPQNRSPCGCAFPN